MNSLSVRAMCIVSLTLAAGAAAQPTFTPVGFLGVERESYCWGISPGGQFVVGESSSSLSGPVTEAYVRSSAGMDGLGSKVPSNFQSVANACSDTRVAVGFTRYNTFGTLYEAFRDADGTIVPADALGDLPGGSFLSSAQGISADGTVSIGYGIYADAQNNSRRQAFVHRAATGMVGLGFLPGDVVSIAYGVSNDGTKVAGQSSTAANATHGILWTLGAGGNVTRQALADLPGGIDFSEAWGISGDGATPVGDSESANGTEACKWSSGVPTPLGDLAGGDFNSSANAASFDGSIIVGYGTSATSGFLGEAVYWDSNGIHSIKDVLTAAGVDTTGWQLQVATGVSADGRIIVGNGVDPLGNPQGWIVTLPSACVADFNQDGDLNPDDLGDFITCYFGETGQAGTCPAADFNNDSDVNPDDLGDFITIYFAGC